MGIKDDFFVLKTFSFKQLQLIEMYVFNILYIYNCLLCLIYLSTISKDKSSKLL